MPNRLVVFDCDGVLTENSSSWKTLHEYFGSIDNTYFAELYRRGLISYLDWMKIDIALMISSWGKPILRNDVINALSKIRLREDARDVVRELKKRGFVVAVVSSGVDIVVEKVCRQLGTDICLYNELIFVDGELIPGGVDRVPLKDKPKIVMELAKSLGVDLENTAYVGDSEWDIDVFKVVGIPIAMEPCGNACKHAKYVVRNLGEILQIPELY